jgi:hypothetical protein
VGPSPQSFQFSKNLFCTYTVASLLLLFYYSFSLASFALRVKTLFTKRSLHRSKDNRPNLQSCESSVQTLLNNSRSGLQPIGSNLLHPESARL